MISIDDRDIQINRYDPNYDKLMNELDKKNVILFKGEKIIKIKGTSKRKAHTRKVKTSDKPKESRLVNQLKFFESHIRNQDFESLGAYDKDGNIVLQKDGEKDKINITKDEGLKLKGTYFTHNHPKGFSFSPSDILCACHNEMKEMRCISKADGSKYSMSMKDGSNLNRKLWDDKVESTYKDADNKTRGIFENAIANKEMTIIEANNTHWHRVWSLVVELCPELKYKRVI